APLPREKLAACPGVHIVRRDAAVACSPAAAVSDAGDRHVRRYAAHQFRECDPARYPRAEGVHRLEAAERAAYSAVRVEGAWRRARQVRFAPSHRLLRAWNAQRRGGVAVDEARLHARAEPARRLARME